MPGTGHQADEGQDASSSQKVTSISCCRGRSELRFVVTGCRVNPGLPVLVLSRCRSLPQDGDVWDHCVSQPPIQPQSCAGLCPIYPREAGAIPGDMLSLPTVLTPTSSLPCPEAKQGWERAQWGDLGRDGAQAPHGCWLCLASGSLGWQGQTLGQGQPGSVGSLPNPSWSQPGPSTAKLGQLCKSPGL